MQRTKNAVRNIFYGVIYKGVLILCPFFIRTILLYTLGTEYLGLKSLFTSLLSFLSLAELGIGNAMVYSMYRPIAERDHDTVCALLSLYRRLYRIIGFVVLGVGLAIMPFLEYLVKGNCPADVNLYVLYGIYLFNSVISYLMLAYKQSLLIAHQRSDIGSKLASVFQLLLFVGQTAVLLIWRSYYLYAILLPVCTIATNLVNSIIVSRIYPEYTCRGSVNPTLKESIKKKVLALIGTKLNSVVLHAADNIVISAFLGLATVAIYGNYYYIINAITGVMTIVYSSITAGLGNSILEESKEKNCNDFKLLSFANAWMTMFCSVCLLCLFQPFMRMWMGEGLLLSMDLVILLVFYFYLYQIRRIVLTYKDAAGIWWEDRFRPYVIMVVNLIGNVILVQLLGLYGVILSTIISMLISLPWENYTVFRYIFNSSAKPYYLRFLLYVMASVLCCGLTYYCCELVSADGIGGIIIKLLVCGILPNLIFLLLFFKTKEFAMLFEKFRGFIKRG